MGDDGGGQQYQTQSSSSNSTSMATPLPGVQPRLDALLENLWAAYGSGQEPSLYSGAMTAPMSSTTRDALSALDARGAAGSPVVGAAGNALISMLDPSSLDLGNNPYFGKAVQAYLNPLTENLNQSVIPNLRAQFEGAGRTGSGADFNTTMRAVTDFDRTTADATSKMAFDQLNANLNRQIQAAGLAPTIAAEDYTDIMARLKAGMAQEGYDQQAIDEAVMRHDYDQTGRADWLARLSQMIQSMYPGGMTTGSSNSSGSSYGVTPSTGSGASGWIGTGLAGLGTLAKFMPFLPGISDARAKDIFGRVGETNEGLPLYLYTYKGDSDPRIGPVAQEVAEFHPEAVSRHPSGYLQIDYARATPVGGLM